MDTHKIISGGKQYLFNVIKNTTLPCPQCGVPACGKEDILWYEFENKKNAIIFDGGYFDMANEEFFEKRVKKTNYNALPEFMKEWSELRGWEDCWDHDGYALNIDDFLRAMELLKSCKMGKWITEADINDMQQLANEAKEKKAVLKIVRG